MLWGAAGVLVPVAIHLLGRRRVRTVAIGTLRFLERARARASARWRLRRWLLLASRMALIAAAALLYAGPGCRTDAGPGTRTAWVLVLDDSPSMAAVRDGRSALDRARDLLDRLLDRAGPGDWFRLVTPGGAGWSDEGFSQDPDAVRRRIASATVRYGGTTVARAVDRAAALAAGVPGGRVVVATDLQAAGWPAGETVRADRVPVHLLDAGWPDPANLWVGRVEASDGRVVVEVGRSGPAAGAVTVTLSRPGERRRVAFLDGPGPARFDLEEAGGTCTVSVEPGGDLGPDDAVRFRVRGRARPRVLLVNGDPRGFAIRDELLFLRRALGPDTDLGRRFRVEEVRLGDLVPARLDGADVVWLANPGPLPPAVADRLRERMEGGLGLIVSAGDRLVPGPGGTGVDLLLPAPVRDRVVVPQDDPGRRPFEPVDVTGLDGPFRPFRDPAAGDLTGVRVRAYWVLDTRAGDGVRAWMRLENGVPLVWEARRGRGRTVFVGTTVDRDAADLCLAPGFVPWVERMLLHAADRLRPAVAAWAVAGRPVDLPYDGPVAVEGPDGGRTGWRPGDPPFVPPVPGPYRVHTARGDVDGFTARLDPAESDLGRLTPTGLDARLGPGAYTLGLPGEEAGGPGGRGRQDLSAVAAGLVLALLAVEAVLSGRWGRRKARPLDWQPEAGS